MRQAIKDLNDSLPSFEPADTATRIGLQTQRLITVNYVTGFLLWRFANSTAHGRVFVGDGSFDFPSSADSVVQKDVNGGRLRVFPRYDQNQSSTKTKPLTTPSKISFSDFFQDGQIINAQNLAKYSPLVERTADLLLWPQKTPGFLVEWDRNQLSHPNPVMMIPFDGLGGIKPLFIEFQAILANGTTNPSSGLFLPTSLALIDKITLASSFSQSVAVRIPPPVIMKTPWPKGLGPWTRAVLSTIRIPFSLYAVPASKVVVHLKLDFRKSQVASSRIAITGFRAVMP